MSEALQSTHHPANIKLSEMCTSADRRKQSPYSVETPYGFHLDLDFLKYVDDIEKGNTIRKVYIHKKSKQPKYSTLPKNFSVPDTRFPSAESRSCRNCGDKWTTTSSWAPSNRCKVANSQELFKSSPCDIGPVLSQPNMHDCKSVKTLSDAKERLEENGKSVQRWVKPPFLRAASMPVAFKELSLEEQHQTLSSPQQKLKYLENDVFGTPSDPVVQENSATSEATPQLNLTPAQIHQIQRQISIGQDRTKEMEEQVKTISELKQQIFVLQEEKKQLNIQMKNQQSTVQNTSHVMDKTECVNAGSQCNSATATIGSEMEEGQVPFSSISPSSEFLLSDDKFEHEKTTELDYQNEFASNFTVSENKKFDSIPHKELLQNSYAVGDSEHRMKDVGVRITEEKLGLVLVVHPSKERLTIEELRTTDTILEKQLESGTREHKLEQYSRVSGASKASICPKTLQGDPSIHLERKHAQDQSEIRMTSNQLRDGSIHGSTEPKLSVTEPSEPKERCVRDITSDLRPSTQSVGSGDCTVNVIVTTLKETRSFGVNTDHITVNGANIMAAVETNDKAMEAAVRVCSKAIETEHAPSLQCISHIITESNRVNEEVEHIGVRDDNTDSNSDNLNNKTRSADGTSAVIENAKECSVIVQSQHSACEKEEDSQNSHSQDVTLDAFLQPESQLISTKPELGQCIKKIEDLLCKQQSFLEQNYPELAQNFKKLCSSIGSLSSQLMNSLQPLSSSHSTLNQSEENSPGNECEPAVFQSMALKSIMKKNNGNFKSSGLSAKKNLQFIGVNGGYETTSSEDSNSSEESSNSDLEKECVNSGNQTQHTDNKAEMSKNTEGIGHDESQPTEMDATVSVMQHCSKRHELKPSLIAACHHLKNHLSELGATNDKGVRQSLNTVQWEWFRISSQKSAASATVQDFLLELREMSPELLLFIVNLTDENQNTALHYSVSHSNFHIVRLLLDTGMCNVDHQNKAGYTATMLASLASAETDEELAVVMQLLHLGNVNVQAIQAGQTALMLAVSHGRINMVKALLSYGANMNIQDDDGSTTLMCASEHGHVEIVKLLLAQPGCNTALTDKDGSTALAIAQQAGQKDIVVLLSTHMDCGISPTL
uniref:KN motif and ankyrin repeat domain-containing protein 1-like n=1 Tax=Pristiophorus japonicus TaxID=55135 RepID=UPI00398EF656